MLCLLLYLFLSSWFITLCVSLVCFSSSTLKHNHHSLSPTFFLDTTVSRLLSGVTCWQLKRGGIQSSPDQRYTLPGKAVNCTDSEYIYNFRERERGEKEREKGEGRKVTCTSTVLLYNVQCVLFNPKPLVIKPDTSMI